MPEDPNVVARRLAAPERKARFYQTAAMVFENGVYGLRLDDKRAMTPGRCFLTVSDPRVAAAIAAEWTAQGETIEPISMPVTRLANSAIDGVAARMAETRAAVLAYAAGDLLCYRAGEPESLVAAERSRWDPILAWAERRLGVRFVLAEGVVHAPQPETTLAALRAELDRYDDPLRLTGLNLATTLTGSALIAFALAEGASGVDEAWAAAHVDEDWNISRWGEDAEAAARRARRFADFRAAALALRSPAEEPG